LFFSIVVGIDSIVERGNTHIEMKSVEMKQ
jgi:hypothetical protein